MEWWGWIPILTQKVFFKKALSDIRRLNIKEVGKDERELINSNHREYALHSEKKYFTQTKKAKYKAAQDIKIIFSLNPNKKIEHVLAFTTELYPIINATCEIEDNGLIKIVLSKNQSITPPRAIRTIYAHIRDLYHTHTHHSTEDLLLQPVIAEDRTDAIKILLIDKYNSKIFYYLKEIKELVGEEETSKSRVKLWRLLGFRGERSKFTAAVDLTTKAEGEMLYALNFIKLFKNEIDNPEQQESLFSNAYSAINVLVKKLELHHSSLLNTIMAWLSVIITALTFFIAILTIGLLYCEVIQLLALSN